MRRVVFGDLFEIVCSQKQLNDQLRDFSVQSGTFGIWWNIRAPSLANREVRIRLAILIHLNGGAIIQLRHMA